MLGNLRSVVALALAVGCSARDATYACGPVGAYLFCDLDQACVEHRSPTGTTPNVWTCERDLGCDFPQLDYCGTDAASAACEIVEAEASDGTSARVSVASCFYP